MVVICNPHNNRRFRVNLDLSRTELPVEAILSPRDQVITWDDYQELVEQYLVGVGK